MRSRKLSAYLKFENQRNRPIDPEPPAMVSGFIHTSDITKKKTANFKKSLQNELHLK